MTRREQPRDNQPMTAPQLDLTPLRKALALLNEAIAFWHAQAGGPALRPHLRSAVIQSFEFTYELSVRLLRRHLMERAESAQSVVDLSFNDLLRRAADAGLAPDPSVWRQWREMRNMTSHAYDEDVAERVAASALAFAADAQHLLTRLDLAHGD